MTNQKKLPPYAKNISGNQNCIVVCTGSDAWDRAKSQGWLSSLQKTLLPLGDDIESYRWDFVYNKDVMIFSHGTLEAYSRLIELSRSILSYGASAVLWCIPELPINKFTSTEAT